ncbi:hypothetical protein HERIO_1551 [Hepatospora eriocheir]|uniref:Uncharacterized protein n=1 Tax=Hepatospora eriocheir TaxID=1081669 RepID=A0A1X0Q9U8_9MICR|nr:hypothetical protein HERIO_1551 [Hepatospora eriocheir]
MYGGNQRFNNYIKENRIDIDNIFDKYTNNKVMRYSQDLMNRIKKEQGIKIDSACNNKDLKTTNIFSETVKSTFSERVKEFPQMATECKNNSSTYIKDKVSYLKEKVTNYSPELAQIGATTFVMADKLSSVLIDTTKKIGNKTITVTSNIGSKIYGEAKEYLDKIKSDKTESSLKSANTINYVYNPRSPLNEKKQDWS